MGFHYMITGKCYHCGQPSGFHYICKRCHDSKEKVKMMKKIKIRDKLGLLLTVLTPPYGIVLGIFMHVLLKEKRPRASKYALVFTILSLLLWITIQIIPLLL